MPLLVREVKIKGKNIEKFQHEKGPTNIISSRHSLHKLWPHVACSNCPRTNGNRLPSAIISLLPCPPAFLPRRIATLRSHPSIIKTIFFAQNPHARKLLLHLLPKPQITHGRQIKKQKGTKRTSESLDAMDSAKPAPQTLKRQWAKPSRLSSQPCCRPTWIQEEESLVRMMLNGGVSTDVCRVSSSVSSCYSSMLLLRRVCRNPGGNGLSGFGCLLLVCSTM